MNSRGEDNPLLSKCTECGALAGWINWPQPGINLCGPCHNRQVHKMKAEDERVNPRSTEMDEALYKWQKYYEQQT